MLLVILTLGWLTFGGCQGCFGASASKRDRGPVSCHVLDTATGDPAEGIKMILEKFTNNNTWQFVMAK